MVVVAKIRIFPEIFKLEMLIFMKCIFELLSL